MINYWLDQEVKEIITKDLTKMVQALFKSGATPPQVQNKIYSYLKTSGYDVRYKVYCKVDVASGEVAITVV